MKRAMIVLSMVLFSAGLLSGCNTIAGAGKDIQKAGDKIEDKAHDRKDGRC